MARSLAILGTPTTLSWKLFFTSIWGSSDVQAINFEHIILTTFFGNMLLFGKCNIPFIYDKPQCDVKNFDIRNYKSEKNELLLNSRRYSILVKCIILSSERPLLWNQLLKVVLYVFQINNIHLSPKDFNPSRPGHFWKLYWNKKLSLIFIFTLLCGVSEGFEVPLRCAFEVP